MIILVSGVVFNRGNRVKYLFGFFYFKCIFIEKFILGYCLICLSNVFILLGWGSMFDLYCCFVNIGKG